MWLALNAYVAGRGVKTPPYRGLFWSKCLWKDIPLEHGKGLPFPHLVCSCSEGKPGRFPCNKCFPVSYYLFPAPEFLNLVSWKHFFSSLKTDYFSKMRNSGLKENPDVFPATNVFLFPTIYFLLPVSRFPLPVSLLLVIKKTVSFETVLVYFNQTSVISRITIA